MKFFGKNSISTFFFYGTRVATIGSLLLVVFITLSFGLNNYVVDNGRFTIPFPLISYFDIKGVYKPSIITSINLILLYISVFSLSLSMIFKSFKTEVLFNTKAINYLNLFALVNLGVFPVFYIIMRMVILKIPLLGGMHNLILSTILGILILFVSAIFKRGLKVQEENDLTI